ncbi:MAG: SDR family oxidoreductase [Halioglobus sp.]|nr:SDR family oxidoreductase [Halioglobus sp.]
MDLGGKRVVITGANGSLGKTVVSKSISLGAQVVCLDIAFSENAAENCYAVDLTNLADTKECFAQIGQFDCVFNLAGGFTMGASTWDESDEQWDLMFKLNVVTLRNVLKAAVPLLLEAKKKGSIVNVGAYGARSGLGDMSAYCASKSVVMRLTESLAEELKHRNINVNAVLPTVIDTPPNRAAMPGENPDMWVSTDDLANTICFLGSDAAAAIHGALLPVRGLSG